MKKGKVELYEGAIRLKGYEPIDLLSDNGFSSHVVYLSEKEGKKYVVKFPNIDVNNNRTKIMNNDDVNLRKEGELLKKLVYFCGIPVIREFFDCKSFRDNHGQRCTNCTRSFSPLYIIKDYIEGKEAGKDNKVKGENNKRILKNLVDSIHFLGYANLDLLQKGNVILDNMGSVWITDFSSVVKIGDDYFGEKVNNNRFREFMHNDRKDLLKLIGNN